MEAQINYTA